MATEAAKQTNLLKKKNDPKQTNWAYGTHSHSEQMHSTYGDDFVEKIGARGSNADAAAKMLAVKNNPKATNWDYGPGTSAETVGVSSTSRAAFQGEPGAMSQLPVETVADLRSSHFKPGYVSDMSPFMKTTAKDLVGQKGPPASLSVAVKADLRKSHFDVGLHNVEWKSMAKQDFSKPVNPKTADLPIETMNDLRLPHYKLGFDQMEYVTTSRQEHRAWN